MLFCSNNNGKIKEMKKLFNNYDIVSLSDLNINLDIEENGKTFLDNAILKAKEGFRLSNMPTIADDSGLEIEVLNGFPGVNTHRFLGNDKSDDERNLYILDLMKDKENRTCYFVCCMAYYDGVNLITKKAVLKGNIAYEMKKLNGFGFNSIFIFNDKYLSELTIDEKNAISPRGMAAKEIIKELKKLS